MVGFDEIYVNGNKHCWDTVDMCFRKKFPTKHLGSGKTLGKLQANSWKLHLITDAFVSFRQISPHLSFRTPKFVYFKPQKDRWNFSWLNNLDLDPRRLKLHNLRLNYCVLLRRIRHNNKTTKYDFNFYCYNVVGSSLKSLCEQYEIRFRKYSF